MCMEKIELWVGLIISLLTLAGLIWGTVKSAMKTIRKPMEALKKDMSTLESKIDEIIELSMHNGISNKYLLKYRIEQLCFRVFAKCKETGLDEIDKDKLTTINKMHEQYKYFSGNGTVDKLVERVNELHIVD